MSKLRANSTKPKRRTATKPRDVSLSGKINVRAAKKGEGELPSFRLLANTGVPMEVNDWPYPLVIDLVGAKYHKAKSPVLMHHDRQKRLGHTTSQEITTGRKGAISAEGVVSATGETATTFVDDSRNGFPFEVSVGARVLDFDFLDAGETAVVNERTVKGPLYIARKTIIRELTVDVLGADSKTSVKIAASQKNQGTPTMFEKWLKAMGLDPKTLSDDQRSNLEASFKELQEAQQSKQQPGGGKTGVKKPKRIRASQLVDDDDESQDEVTRQRELAAAESERLDGIRMVFARYPDVNEVEAGEGSEKTIKVSTFKANAIRKGMTPDQVELVLLRANMPGGAGEGPAIHITPNIEGPVYSEALACSVAKQFGMPRSIEGRDGQRYGWEHQFSQKAVEASDDRRIRRPGLHYLMDLVIQAAEGTTYSGDRKSADFAAAYVEAAIKVQGGPRYNHLRASGPFSTLTVNYIFENVANKMLEQRFAMLATAYQEIVRIKNLSDFKPHTLYRLDENLGYLKVGASGELKHGSLTDSKKSVQAETYGRLIALTRVHQRNDDMDAFQQLITGLVEGSAWAIEAAVFELLLANAGSFFSVGNKNLMDLDLGIAGITKAEQLFMDQVSDSGKPIMSQPNRLLVGTQDGVLAQEIFGKSALLDSETNGSQVFVENPHKGKYRVVKTPYLNNTAIRNPAGGSISNQDSDRWYLFGDPNLAAAIILGALDGRVIPYIESGETTFDTLGMQWRGYHDIGVAQGDPEAAVLSTGDNESA